MSVCLFVHPHVHGPSFPSLFHQGATKGHQTLLYSTWVVIVAVFSFQFRLFLCRGPALLNVFVAKYSESTWICPQGMGIPIDQILLILPMSTSRPLAILDTVWLPLLYSRITLSPHPLITFLNWLQWNMQTFVYPCMQLECSLLNAATEGKWEVIQQAFYTPSQEEVVQGVRNKVI